VDRRDVPQRPRIGQKDTAYAKSSNQKMLKKQMLTHPERGRFTRRFRGVGIQRKQWSRCRCGKKNNGKSKQVLIDNHPKTGSVVWNRGMHTLAEMMLMAAMMIGIAAAGNGT